MTQEKRNFFMDLHLGQLVYTSFSGVGLRIFASAQVPMEIQQAFIQSVVFQHWNSYNPPRSEYRAVVRIQVVDGGMREGMENPAPD